MIVSFATPNRYVMMVFLCCQSNEKEYRKEASEKNQKVTRLDFKYKFSVPQPAGEVFDKICLISEWWTMDTEGAIKNLHDEFTVHFGDSFVKMQMTQMVPGKEMTWLVRNCLWSFLENKREWNGTRIVWNITTKENSTQLSMTHVGLVPGIESFDICKEGWGLYVGNSLFRLITEGSGIPFEPTGNKNGKTCEEQNLKR